MTPLVKTPLHKKNGDWYRKKICGVYLITNTSNGMHYCGQSVDISARWQQHLTPNKSAIGSAIAEAPERFKFRILERCPKEMLNDKEKHYIQVYNCVYPNGYNKTSGGSSGSAVSDATKKKISNTQKGKTFSEEHKQKLSDAKKGKTLSEEHRRNIGEALIGNTNTKGKSHIVSEEHKQKLSDLKKGVLRSEETKAKMTEAQKQRWAQKKLQQTSALSDDTPYINLETDAQ